MEELYTYLDWYSFVNYTEVLWAVQEYYETHFAEHNSSWWDLVDYGNMADEYCLERWILWFDELQELKDKIEELEDFDYSYAEDDNYIRACEACDKDPREEWDLTDEELLIEEVKRKAEEWELYHIKNMLQDIDLDNDYFLYDWYWWPRNIERSDSEYIIENKLKELRADYDSLLEDLHSRE